MSLRCVIERWSVTAACVLLTIPSIRTLAALKFGILQVMLGRGSATCPAHIVVIGSLVVVVSSAVSSSGTLLLTIALLASGTIFVIGVVLQSSMYKISVRFQWDFNDLKVL